MDLLLIVRKIWRYKLVTVPIVFLTFFGAVYAVAVKEPLYEATSSYLLINPPAPPTAEEVARNPALGRVRADNPYTRFADQAVVIDVLSRSVSSDAARQSLMRAGADPRYTVGSGAQFGSSSPIVQITGTGPTPRAAMRTADVVGHALVGELDRIQRAQEVDSRYRITALHVEVPDGAQLRASGQLRMLVGVLVLGAILLFVLVSVIDALAALRRERREALARRWEPWDDLGVLDPDPDLDTPVGSNGRGDGMPSVKSSTAPIDDRTERSSSPWHQSPPH